MNIDMVTLLILLVVVLAVEALYNRRARTVHDVDHKPERVTWYYDLHAPIILECTVALGEVWVKLEGETRRYVVDRIPIGMTLNCEYLIGKTLLEAEEIVCRTRFRHLCISS